MRVLAFWVAVMTAACTGTGAGTTTPPDDRRSGDTHSVAELDSAGGPTDSQNQNIVTAAVQDGVWLTSVDATASDAWVYFDIDNGTQVSLEEGWDLAFQRSRIMVNGGVSGAGEVSVSVLPGVSFASLQQAPSSGYRTDQENPQDASNPDLVFLSDGGWYEYDVTTHVLSVRDQVYVIRTTDASYFKIQLDSYYRDDVGGYPTFQWAAVVPPALEDGFSVDASSGWTYVNLDVNKVIEPSEPYSDLNWDIAFNQAQIRTNSGTSGSGFGGAQFSTVGWSELKGSDSVGYAIDTSLPIPGPPGSGDFSGNPALADWFDYDPVAHTLSPKASHFLVRAADGDYFKLRILDYDAGVYRVEAEAVTRVLQVHTSTFPAGSWSELNFATGQVMSMGEHAWDLGINGLQCRTNSGSSGDGSGGVITTNSETLEGVSEVPRSGCYFLAKGHVCECDITAEECTAQQGAWTPQCACTVNPVVDSFIPVPGPPGSGEYSGNEVLSDWYDYDPVNHLVTAKPSVFLIRDSDGTWAKLQFSKYAEGAVTARWVWAGPGRYDF